jgi:hypothetical protein
MYLHQPIIGAQQATYRALLEPQPMHDSMKAAVNAVVTKRYA